MGLEGGSFQVEEAYPQPLRQSQGGGHPANDRRVAPPVVGRLIVHLAH